MIEFLSDRFRDNIHVVHFAGELKPWQLTYNPQNEQLSENVNGQSDIQRDLLLSWWRIMNERVWTILQFNQVNFFSLSPRFLEHGIHYRDSIISCFDRSCMLCFRINLRNSPVQSISSFYSTIVVVKVT